MFPWQYGMDVAFQNIDPYLLKLLVCFNHAFGRHLVDEISDETDRVGDAVVAFGVGANLSPATALVYPSVAANQETIGDVVVALQEQEGNGPIDFGRQEL